GTSSTAAVQPSAQAADPSATEAPPSRVGRLSLASRDVNVLISPEKWLDGELNFPLATGASVRASQGGHAQIGTGADTISLTPESEIEITRLDDRAIQVGVVRGRIRFALRRLGDGESVTVDVSGENIPLLQSGDYEIDAGGGIVAVSTEGTRSEFDET